MANVTVEVYNNDEVGLNELHDEAIEFCMKVTQPIELHESYKHYEYGEQQNQYPLRGYCPLAESVFVKAAKGVCYAKD